MLARVLKRQAGAAFAPYSIPVLGQSRAVSNGVNEFVLPEIDAFQYVSQSVDDAAMDVSRDDMSAEDILQSARDEAARIIARAEENSSIIQQIASDKSAHAAHLDIDAEIADRVADLRLQLAETIVKISALAGEMTANIEHELVELALQIAKKVVVREVTIDREIALTLVKVSLAKLHNRSVAEVHLNPDDFIYVKSHTDKLNFRGSLDLIEDKSITIGGCLIHTETGDIDARIESQFDEISHGLLN